jgi:methylated-DNA-[protein]-cysteine S-methyltransferase
MNNTASPARPAPLVAQAPFHSPLGVITLVASDAGLAGAWFEGQKYHPGPLVLRVDPALRWVALAIAQLRDYFDGRLQHFELPLDLRGTPFQRGVWQALCGIAPGATTSYGALAASTGTPAAVRAVGAAVGRNPASVIVPCHRVLGRDGSLTGYAGGLHRKQALLALERAL